MMWNCGAGLANILHFIVNFVVTSSHHKLKLLLFLPGEAYGLTVGHNQCVGDRVTTVASDNNPDHHGNTIGYITTQIMEESSSVTNDLALVKLLAAPSSPVNKVNITLWAHLA